MKKIVATEKAPKAIGPYSQAVVHNGMAYLSGQIPLDPATGQSDTPREAGGLMSWAASKAVGVKV